MAYEDQMAAELPKSLAAIAEKAKGLNNPVDQINSVTSGLADAVRYVGDWRTVKGAYHPRALNTIAESGYGDCKDFTVATGAMLKRLGYEVRAAWVARGKNWVVSPLKLAAPDMNHAILFAKKDGRDFWIDPTNSTSFAQAIYADIANRPAVVLHPEGPRAMQIPAMLPVDGEIQTTLNLDFGDKTSEIVKAQGKISLTGRGILSMTGQELNYAKQNLDYMLIGWITTATNLKSWQVGDYDLKSRTVKDLHTSFEFTEMWRPLVTSAGRGYSMPASPFVNFFRFRRDQRISGVRFDDPIRYRKTYQFRGGQPVVAKAIECRGQSRWATYSRSMKRESSHVLLDDAIELKVPSISAKEIQSDEFAKFQADFLGCMHDAVIVFKDDQTPQKRP
jgi:transglutaminase-like putative cysteine protease